MSRGSVIATGSNAAWRLPASLVAALVLTILAVAAYSNSFDLPFVYDGVAFIYENPWIREPNPSKLTVGTSRPVSYYSFALNYALGGYNVWGYHAVNLAIHLGAACALYGLVRRTLEFSPRVAGRYGGAARYLALSVAAIWLVHPLQTASVTYIYQRQESLMGLMYLLTMYAVLRFIQGQRSEGEPEAATAIEVKPIGWFLLAVTASLIGMGTKEVMVTAPLMALWYDLAFWAADWQEILKRRKALYLALFTTDVIPVAVVWAMKEQYQSVGLLVGSIRDPLDYARSQPGVICHYLWLCLDPRGVVP